MPMKDSPEKIRMILDLLYKQVWRGLAFFECAKSLHRAFARGSLARYSCFLAVVYYASVRESTLAFATVVEQRKNRSGITVHCLLTYAENSPSLFSNTDYVEVREYARQHRRQLQEHQTLIDNVLQQRDRILAHLDKKHINDLESLLSDPAGINLTEMEQCFHVILEIVDFYMRYYGTQDDLEPMKKTIDRDVDTLLKLIEKHTEPVDWVRPPGQ